MVEIEIYLFSYLNIVSILALLQYILGKSLLFLAMTLFFYNAQAQSLNDSLIVHYPLDGNANDIGPNNLDGTYFASPATDCAGNITGATYFDGLNDYIELPIDSRLQPQLPVSFSFKVMIDSYTNPNLFFSNDYNHTKYYGFWLNITVAGYLHVSYGDGGSQDVSNRTSFNATTKLEFNRWYNITVVIKGPTSANFYLDCSVENINYAGTGSSLAYSSGISKSSIGRFARQPYFAYFKGYLDDFRMWNRALNYQDVLLLNSSHCNSDSISTSICQGDSISINSIDYYKTAGIYTDTLFGASTLGCDSVVIINLSVLPVGHTTLNRNLCIGETYDFNGRILSTTGRYIDTIQGANTCDSIVLLNLIVNPKKFTNLNQTICGTDIFNFNGNLLTASGTYIDTLLSSSSCDSIIILNLSVLPRNFTSLNEEICSGKNYNFNGNILSATGTYFDTLPATNSCDSIITLNLNVLPRSFTSFQAAICLGDTFNFNGSKLSTTGIYSDTLFAANLCDSIVTLDLIVKPLNFTNIIDSIFSNGSYDFNGTNISEAGVFLDTLTASNGCDSIITLDLRITYHRGSVSMKICPGDTVQINDSSYFKTGNYIDTLYMSASDGADSLLYIFIEDLSVEKCFPLSLTIPNIFSPNNDGILDEFMIQGENVDQFHLQVFSRWGEPVFSSNNIQQVWDGRKHGQKCEEGNYYYIIKGISAHGKSFTRTGWFFLIR